MFDQDIWRRQIGERLHDFARSPRQELQLAGAPSLLGYLLTQILEPFLEAFQREPIAAVLALAELSHTPGADQIVKRASRMRYQSAAQTDRELRANKEMRLVAEQLMIGLQAVPIARQRLNSSREGWLRSTLEQETAAFPGEFDQLRRVLRDPGWQSRYEALRSLRARQGRYTPADLVLIHDGLADSAAHVRTAAARALGTITETPPALLSKTLIRMALYDCDAETRFAAARSVGRLREQITSPQLLDYLSNCLFDADGFVRSSAALVLGQLGELASAPTLIISLSKLLEDNDSYTREAAARALGKIGEPAATPDVLEALTRAANNGDLSVHEAATDAIARLREIRAEQPLQGTLVTPVPA